jgi:hypothetical protein
LRSGVVEHGVFVFAERNIFLMLSGTIMGILLMTTEPIKTQRDSSRLRENAALPQPAA